MADIKAFDTETAKSIPKSFLQKLMKIRKLTDAKAEKVSDPTEGNLVTLDSDGNIQDSGMSPPSGDIVGSSDEQTLTNKVLQSPVISNATASRLAAYDSDKQLTSTNLESWVLDGTGTVVTGESGGKVSIDLNQQNHEADASASHSITDPADAPANADALRDDLVANALPEITAALDALGAKINAILLKLETAEVFKSV